MRAIAAVFAATAVLLAPPASGETWLLDTWRGHTNEVYTAAFTPDGKRVLTASDDGTLKFWDVSTGEALSSWRASIGGVGAAVLAPDAARAISGSEEQTLKIWDTATGKELAVLRGHTAEIQTIALSPDGRTLASTCFNGELRLWDIETRKELFVLQKGETARALDAAFSPDGKKLLAAQWDKSLRLWDVRTGRELAVWRGHDGRTTSVAFSPDGTKALSGSMDNTVRLWDAATGKALAVWRGHKGFVYIVAFSPDGKTALSGGADGAVRKWDAASGKELAVWKGHQGGVRDVAFSPDGSLAVSAGEDYVVKLWDVSGEAIERRRPSRTPGAPPAAAPPEQHLGNLLFFDRRLSGDGTLDCSSCHIPAKAFTDGRVLSLGYPDTLYFRNTPSLLNSASQKHLYWDGRFPAEDLPSLIRDHISEAHFMGADGRLVVEKLRQAPGYVAAFRDAYGTEPDYGKTLEALAAFVRGLRSGETPYDRFRRGETQALGRAAERGAALFTGKAGCAACHSGPQFSDGGFHRRGVPENPDVFDNPIRHITFRRFFKVLGFDGYANLREDVGHYALTKAEEDRGAFKTPPLRDVARTAPYMHNGMLKTLEETVAFENPSLTRQETRDIAAFLESLTSDTPAFPIPSLPPYEPRAREKPEPPSGNAPVESPSPPKTPRPLGPLGEVPVPDDNPLTPAKVELGELLFFEPRLSGNGYRFCASCHEPAMGWGDGTDLSKGYEGTLHWRNSKTLLNVAYYSRLNWDGDAPNLEEQARSAITSNLSGNGDPALIEERLAQSPEYVKLFKEAFGVDRPHFEGVLKAIASFERAVPVSRNVPFDRYARGDKTALSPEAVRGRALFEGKAGCIRCHNGPLATDEDFHATGVPRHPDFDEVALRQVTVRFQHVVRGVPEEVYRNADSDPGLFFTTRRAEDAGKFRTPSLRELKHTAPYMHNGVFGTLEEVVAFYDKGGGSAQNKTPLLKPLGLTPGEKTDLVSFLESLSGDRIIVEAPATPGPYTIDYQ